MTLVALHPIGAPPGAGEVMTWWTFDPLVIAALATGAAVYTRGALRLWRHAGPGHGVSRWQVAAYIAGLATIAIALLSPVDGASDVLFSAHMVQHELLMLVAAPLIVLARPLAPMLWALPRRWRVGLGHALGRRGPRRAWAIATAPAVALIVHGAVVWLWHVPAAFDTALAHEWLHQVQHVMFFATAVVFWWSLVHGRYHSAGYGVGVAFVFFTALHTGILAALISLDSHAWYSHGARTVAWGMDPVGDQQRAGLLMWVPAGVLMTSIGLALLAAWLGESERRVRQSRHPGLVGDREAP